MLFDVQSLTLHTTSFQAVVCLKKTKNKQNKKKIKIKKADDKSRQICGTERVQGFILTGKKNCYPCSRPPFRGMQINLTELCLLKVYSLPLMSVHVANIIYYSIQVYAVGSNFNCLSKITLIAKAKLLHNNQ